MIKGVGLRRFFGACVLTLAALPAAAQNHSDLKWKTVETEHFIVYYHEGAEASARMSAQIAEAVYEPVTTLYDFEPKHKTHFIIGDYQDYANGAAYFFDGKFEIWVTNLEFDLRGTTQWMWNVITHEFVHMINIQASQRTPVNIPAVYFQLFDYEKERRSDVLTGYPNTLISYPYSGVNVPAWVAEGTAQYMGDGFHHDYWDAHRDMIVRSAAAADDTPSYTALSVFKGSLHSEQIYDHGFSIIRYMSQTYGEESLPKLMHALRGKARLSAEGAFKEAIGKSGRELYDEWKAAVSADANAKLAAIEPGRRDGRPLGTPGTYNILPQFSPDGKTLAWLSSLGSPFHRTSLVTRSIDPADSTDADIEVLVPGATGSFSWAPDGSAIYYAKRATENRYGSLYFDLYRYDIESEDHTRLTRGQRLRDPSISPDGTQLAAVQNGDGKNNLVLVALPAEEEAAEVTVITTSEAGRQFYNPQWTADGSSLVVDTFEAAGDIYPSGTRSIMQVDARPGGAMTPIIDTPSDERMPIVLDGGDLLYSSDAATDGFRKFDIYRRAAGNGTVTRVTSVFGGAFYPAVSPDGSLLAYSRYEATGYKIFLLDMNDALGGVVTEFSGLDREPSTVTLADIEWDPKPYRGKFARFQVSPRVLIDEGRLKLGAYASALDVLDKQSIFGGIAVGEKFDADIFAIYENRMWWPTLFAEAFWIRKHRTDTSDAKLAGLARKWDIDLRYDAFLLEAGMKLEYGSPFGPSFSQYALSYRNSRNHLNLQVVDIFPTTGLVDEGGLVILPKDGWDYYRGHDIVLRMQKRAHGRSLDTEINPVGSHLDLTYMYSRNDLSTSGQQEVNEAGIITTVFEDNNFHQVEGSYTHSKRLPAWSHALELRLGGGWIDRRVDDFFWFRVGSRPGLRGYTYYTLEGRAYGTGRATYRFPILPEIDKRLFQFIFERLYGGVFYEAGVIYETPTWDDISLDRIGRDAVRDVGFELRLDMTNFYTFPARVSFEGAYPLDRVRIPDSLLEENEQLLTDKGWKFYFGLLFGY